MRTNSQAADSPGPGSFIVAFICQGPFIRLCGSLAFAERRKIHDAIPRTPTEISPEASG
jgi:hypothetical protein